MEKNVDDVGRFVIPKFIRDNMGLDTNPYLSIEYDPDRKEITLRNAERSCIACGSDENLLEIKNHIFLCKKCLQHLNQKA